MEVTEVWYVSGPMTGYPNYNWVMFEAMTGHLRRLGKTVITPVEIDEEMGMVEVVRAPDGTVLKVRESAIFDYNVLLKRDLDEIEKCNHIVLLPGWQKSNGAKKELAHAILLGCEVHLYSEVFTDHLK